MRSASLTRQQLQIINKRTLRYPLDNAERDYYLTVALSLIADSPLAQMLVFKGGTALHHCYLPQHRFSEDIDFSCINSAGLSLALVKEVLERDGLFEVRKEYVSRATIKIERLWFPGVWGQPGAIKVEIDHLQNVLLPPRELPYANVWGLPITLPVMDVREMCAEKLRAACQRARYRDFYDLYLLFELLAPDVEDLVGLLHRKEVRRPITVDGLLEHWQIAVREFQEGKDLVHFSRAIPNEDIGAFLETIQFAPILPNP